MIGNPSSNQGNLPFITSLVENALVKKIEESYEETKKQFIEKLDRDKAQAVAAITLQILKQVNIQEVGTSIVIKIIENKPQ